MLHNQKPQFTKIGYYRNLMLSVSTQTSIALKKDACSSKADSCKAISKSLRKRFIGVVTPSIQSEVCIKSIREIKNRGSCHSERAAILPIKDIISIGKESKKTKTQYDPSNEQRKVASRTRKLQEIVLQNQENVEVESNSLKPSLNHLFNIPETPIHRLLCESQITYRFH